MLNSKSKNNPKNFKGVVLLIFLKNLIFEKSQSIFTFFSKIDWILNRITNKLKNIKFQCPFLKDWDFQGLFFILNFDIREFSFYIRWFDRVIRRLIGQNSWLINWLLFFYSSGMFLMTFEQLDLIFAKVSTNYIPLFLNFCNLNLKGSKSRSSTYLLCYLENAYWYDNNCPINYYLSYLNKH